MSKRTVSGLMLTLLFASMLTVGSNGQVRAADWSIEIINKDDPVDYPTSINGGVTVQAVVKVRVTVPLGETGEITITADSRFWADPMPVRLAWLFPEYQEKSLECGGGTTTHEFVFDLSAPDVIRECFGIVSISAELYEASVRKARDPYQIHYTIAPSGDSAVDVKFRGIIEDVNIFWDLFPIGVDVMITEILEDPASLLTVDSSLYVHDDTTILEDLNIGGDYIVGDRVEVYCDYHPNSVALIWQPYHHVKVTIKEDVNFDFKVDILDVVVVAKAYGSYPGHPRWNNEADFNGDQQVNIIDISHIAQQFGWLPGR